MRDVRKALKLKAIEHLGGVCKDCRLSTTYTSVYDFHHKSPSEKDANLGRLFTTTTVWEEIVSEVNKCDLLCSNCHRIRHAVEGRESPE